MAIVQTDDGNKTITNVKFEDREYHAIAMQVVYILNQQEQWLKDLAKRVQSLGEPAAVKETVACPRCSALTSPEMLVWLESRRPPDSNCPTCGVFLGI